MLTITDTTLSAINPASVTEDSVQKFYTALLALGIDYIEVTPHILPLLGNISDPSRVILRKEFFLSHGDKKIAEITTNVLAANHGKVPGPYLNYDALRAVGGESLLLADYFHIFSEIFAASSLPITFCTKNAGYAATALVTEWVLAGGKQIACSFMGTGGSAPLEEVLLSLQVNGYDLPNINIAQLKPLGMLWQTLTGRTISSKKPIIGKKIFEVESGTHINGLMKNCMNYEPFSPEQVGAKREFILGKFSGKSAVSLKLQELSINEGVDDLDNLLHLIREKSIQEKRSISDMEFYSLIQHRIGAQT